MLSKPEIELTILLPCLNEAETLATCIRKASSFLTVNVITGEIVVADNGSTDGSRQIAADLGASVVDVSERGYGAALLGGIEVVRGRYVVMGDADDSYDFTNLGLFLDKLRGGADVVIGNRFAGGIAPGAMPFLHKYLGNPVLSFLGRLFFGVRVRDFHCGLRAFRVAAVKGLRLKSPGMEFASEMVVRSALAGLTIVEVPTMLRPDGRNRPPHLKTWHDGWRHLKFLLMYARAGCSSFRCGPDCVGFAGRDALVGPIMCSATSSSTSTRSSACFFTIAGVQLVSFGAISRTYAAISGFLPAKTRAMTVLRHATTERLALGGAMLAVLGAAAFGYALNAWAMRDFGPLPDPTIPRMVLGGMTTIVIGLQVLFTGFVLGILGIPLQGAPRTARPAVCPYAGE
jgi:hypothetical protein